MKWQTVIVILATVLMPSLLYANTWTVEKSGEGDFLVIQDAIDVAAPGDTIRIGPGRYSEYKTYVYPGGDWFVYANVVIEDITLIGAGEDVTFIGPTSPSTWGVEDNSTGIMYGLDVVSGYVAVSEMSITDVNIGAYVDRGTFDFIGVSFLRGKYGALVYVEGDFLSCGIDSMTTVGIATQAPASSVSIIGCSFSNNRSCFNFQSTLGVSLIESTFDDCIAVGQFSGSSGEMRDCVASNVLGTGMGVLGSGTVLLANNVIDGGLYNLVVYNGANNLTCTGNVFKNATIEAINIANCTPVFNNNHIFKGGEYAVKIEGYTQLPTVHVDMTNNYWGTSEIDSVRAWIYDSNDQLFPQHHGVVDFDPFSDVPVPNDKESFGSFKAMFR